jgi:hypothetical protein
MIKNLTLISFALALFISLALVQPAQAADECAWMAYMGPPAGCSLGNNRCTGTRPNSPFGVVNCFCCPVQAGCCFWSRTAGDEKTATTAPTSLAKCYSNSKWAVVRWFKANQKADNETCYMLVQSPGDPLGCCKITGTQGVSSVGGQIKRSDCYKKQVWADKTEFAIGEYGVNGTCMQRVGICCQINFKDGTSELRTVKSSDACEAIFTGYKAAFRSVVDWAFMGDAYKDVAKNKCYSVTPSTPAAAAVKPGETGAAQTVTTTTVEVVGEYDNPLNTTSIAVLIGKVINAMMGIVGAIALMMIVWGGLQWMLAAGNDQKIKKGSQTVLWASIGLLIMFIAYIIVRAVIEAIGAG